MTESGFRIIHVYVKKSGKKGKQYKYMDLAKIPKLPLIKVYSSQTYFPFKVSFLNGFNEFKKLQS